MGIGKSVTKGHVAHECKVALVLIDVVNPVDFPEAELFLREALPAAEKLAALKAQAASLNVPCIYANDNFGTWRSDFKQLVARCMEPEARGRRIVERLIPSPDDYFVLKPKHSGFYSTPLDTLLRYLKAELLILTGFAANICVWATASDAFMRDYHLWVPEDCVASNTRAQTEMALGHMRTILHADIADTEKRRLASLLDAGS